MTARVHDSGQGLQGPAVHGRGDLVGRALVPDVPDQLSRSRADAAGPWRRGRPHDPLSLDPGLCAGAGEADPTPSACVQWLVASGRDIPQGEGPVDLFVPGRGQTIDLLLSAKRDAAAAKRFFRKALGQPHTVNPRTITVDKNPAYPAAVTAMKRESELWRFSRLRQVKYLNNIVEQDHRRIKRLVRPGLGFGSLPT